MLNKGTNKVYVLIPVIKSWPRLHRNLHSKKAGFKISAWILCFILLNDIAVFKEK
jgi:hypothetical protein